jgi:hypothetical protein
MADVTIRQAAVDHSNENPDRSEMNSGNGVTVFGAFMAPDGPGVLVSGGVGVGARSLVAETPAAGWADGQLNVAAGAVQAERVDGSLR